MGDIFDEIASGVGGEMPITTSAPAPDIFDEIAATARPHSELRAVANDALTGAGNLLGFVDQFNPIRSQPGTAIPTIGMPPLFGLSGSKEEPFTDLFSRVTKDYGVQTEDKPQTQLGRLAGNVAENAIGAAPFGPAAMAANAILGGGGGYIGESAFGPTGRMAGSFLGGISPAALSKIGIFKEIGEQLGPTLSKLPGVSAIFGDAPIQAAVGRALGDVAEDVPALEANLNKLAQIHGPQTQLNALKTTAELVGDRGLARATDAIEAAVPSSPFKGLADDRAAVRASEVLKNYDPKISAYETSKELEKIVGQSADNIESVNKAIWAQFAQDLPVQTKLPGVAEGLQNSLDNLTYTGANPATGEGAGLLKLYNNVVSGDATSFGALQALRAKAGEVARATGSPTADSADRLTHKVATTLVNHLDDMVDANVASGNFPAREAEIWRVARAQTKGKINTFAAPKPGTDNVGTKGLEQVALRGQALDNTALLREGLNSPDKMAAHIQAAKAGGEDVTPLYQQALKSELDGVPQSRWGEIIDSKRPQWDKAFTAEEMATIDKNILDVADQQAFQRASTTSGSQTNPRGKVQDVLNAQKGLAALSVGAKNVTPLLSAAAGAQQGWSSSDTTSGGIAKAAIGGAAGLLLGKAAKGAAVRASESFDNLLITALKDPKEALKAINAAKPSEVKKALTGAMLNAGKATAVRGANNTLNSLFGDVFSDKESEKKSPASTIDEVFSKGDNMEKKPISFIEQEIDKDPIDSTIYEIESGRNPKAKNPKSTAAGGFQLIKNTQKALGVTDPYDLGQNYEGYKKLRAENQARFGDDPATLYAAHYLGAPLLAKVLKGAQLSKTEQEQVDYLKSKVLPKFNRIYNSKTKQVQA